MAEPIVKIGTHVYVTPDAEKLLHKDEIRAALRRHVYGDWGEVSLLQRWENAQTLKGKGRFIVSIYRDRNGRKFQVDTKHYTTVALIR